MQTALGFFKWLSLLSWSATAAPLCRVKLSPREVYRADIKTGDEKANFVALEVRCDDPVEPAKETKCFHDGDYSHHYRCNSQAAAQERCEMLGLTLCTKHQIPNHIGMNCAFMWTSSNRHKGYYLGKGGEGCGTAGTLYSAEATYNGEKMFDAACCKAPCSVTADFNQKNLNGVQDSSIAGTPGDTSGHGYIFSWINDGWRKMVLASEIGVTKKVGYVAETEGNWKDPSTWTENSLYTIENFVSNCQACTVLADFNQTNIAGIQATAVVGVPDVTGDYYVFAWVNGGWRKMVLADEFGATIKMGYMGDSSADWDNATKWTEVDSYTIANFKNNCQAADIATDILHVKTCQKGAWNYKTQACEACPQAQKYAYVGCWDGFHGVMSRPYGSVPATIAGVQQCRDACAGGGYTHFGFECPRSNEVFCECGNADGPSGFPLGTSYPKGRCETFNGGSCSGPFTLSGAIGTYAMGSAHFGSVYSVAEQASYYSWDLQPGWSYPAGAVPGSCTHVSADSSCSCSYQLNGNWEEMHHIPAVKVCNATTPNASTDCFNVVMHGTQYFGRENYVTPHIKCTAAPGFDPSTWADPPRILERAQVMPPAYSNPIHAYTRQLFHYGYETIESIIQNTTWASNTLTAIFLQSFERQSFKAVTGPTVQEMVDHCQIKMNVFLDGLGETSVGGNGYMPITPDMVVSPLCVADQMNGVVREFKDILAKMDEISYDELSCADINWEPQPTRRLSFAEDDQISDSGQDQSGTADERKLEAAANSSYYTGMSCGEKKYIQDQTILTSMKRAFMLSTYDVFAGCKNIMADWGVLGTVEETVHTDACLEQTFKFNGSYNPAWLEDPCCNVERQSEQCCAKRNLTQTRNIIQSYNETNIAAYAVAIGGSPDVAVKAFADLVSKENKAANSCWSNAVNKWDHYEGSEEFANQCVKEIEGVYKPEFGKKVGKKCTEDSQCETGICEAPQQLFGRSERQSWRKFCVTPEYTESKDFVTPVIACILKKSWNSLSSHFARVINTTDWSTDVDAVKEALMNYPGVMVKRCVGSGENAYHLDEATCTEQKVCNWRWDADASTCENPCQGSSCPDFCNSNHTVWQEASKLPACAVRGFQPSYDDCDAIVQEHLDAANVSCHACMAGCSQDAASCKVTCTNCSTNTVRYNALNGCYNQQCAQFTSPDYPETAVYWEAAGGCIFPSLSYSDDKETDCLSECAGPSGPRPTSTQKCTLTMDTSATVDPWTCDDLANGDFDEHGPLVWDAATQGPEPIQYCVVNGYVDSSGNYIDLACSDSNCASKKTQCTEFVQNLSTAEASKVLSHTYGPLAWESNAANCANIGSICFMPMDTPVISDEWKVWDWCHPANDCTNASAMCGGCQSGVGDCLECCKCQPGAYGRWANERLIGQHQVCHNLHWRQEGYLEWANQSYKLKQIYALSNLLDGAGACAHQARNATECTSVNGNVPAGSYFTFFKNKREWRSGQLASQTTCEASSCYPDQTATNQSTCEASEGYCDGDCPSCQTKDYWDSEAALLGQMCQIVYDLPSENPLRGKEMQNETECLKACGGSFNETCKYLEHQVDGNVVFKTCLGGDRSKCQDVSWRQRKIGGTGNFTVRLKTLKCSQLPVDSCGWSNTTALAEMQCSVQMSPCKSENQCRNRAGYCDGDVDAAAWADQGGLCAWKHEYVWTNSPSTEPGSWDTPWKFCMDKETASIAPQFTSWGCVAWNKGDTAMTESTCASISGKWFPYGWKSDRCKHGPDGKKDKFYAWNMTEKTTGTHMCCTDYYAKIFRTTCRQWSQDDTEAMCNACKGEWRSIFTWKSTGFWRPSKWQRNYDWKDRAMVPLNSWMTTLEPWKLSAVWEAAVSQAKAQPIKSFASCRMGPPVYALKTLATGGMHRAQVLDVQVAPGEESAFEESGFTVTIGMTVNPGGAPLQVTLNQDAAVNFALPAPAPSPATARRLVAGTLPASCYARVMSDGKVVGQVIGDCAELVLSKPITGSITICFSENSEIPMNTALTQDGFAQNIDGNLTALAIAAVRDDDNKVCGNFSSSGTYCPSKMHPAFDADSPGSFTGTVDATCTQADQITQAIEAETVQLQQSGSTGNPSFVAQGVSPPTTVSVTDFSGAALDSIGIVINVDDFIAQSVPSTSTAAATTPGADTTSSAASTGGSSGDTTTPNAGGSGDTTSSSEGSNVISDDTTTTVPTPAPTTPSGNEQEGSYVSHGHVSTMSAQLFVLISFCLVQ